MSTRPLSATRLNDAARDAVATLEDDAFRSASSVARETDADLEAVATLFDRLHRRQFLEWRPARDRTHRPPVSVVVTVRNDRDNLRRCLDALAALSYPTYEVVVVDDGSTDGTPALAADHRLADEGCLRVVSVGHADEPLGIGASRNRGVDAAAFDVIAFTDADCRPRPDWLADLVPCLAAHDLIGGRVRPAGETTASAYEAVNSSLDMGAYAARVDPDGATPYLATANLVGTREVFESVPFPERNVAEDVAVCWDALEAGFDVVYTPTGVVEHAYRSGRPFAGRRSTYGASEALLAREYDRTDADRVGVSLVGLLVVTLAVVASVASGPVSIAAFGVAASLLGLAGIVHGDRLRTRRRQLPGVTWIDVARSWVRERLSSVYAISREVLRYYALPLVPVSVLAWMVGARPIAGAILVGISVATVLPIVVEYRVHEPDASLVGYAGYFLADHFGYQVGVYRGAISHRTVAHLRPDRRFAFVGVGASVLVTLAPDRGTDPVETVCVGDVSARFRVESSAEQWWFEDPALRGERPVIADLVDRLDPDDTFLDVGANVGLYSCLVGRALEAGAVVSVEPHPANATRLAENLELNDVNARLVRKALGSTMEDGVLERPDGESGDERRADPGDGTHVLSARTASSATEAHADQTEAHVDRTAAHADSTHEPLSTPVVTGDSLVGSDAISRPTVIKIDVEGTEADVIAGLSETLSSPVCRLVYCELHPDASTAGNSAQYAVERTLESHGFDVTTIREFPDGRRIVRASAAPDDTRLERSPPDSNQRVDDRSSRTA